MTLPDAIRPVKMRWISAGVEYPTVSGALSVRAPASNAACITSARNSGSVRIASSALNSTSSVKVRANSTARTAAASTS